MCFPDVCGSSSGRWSNSSSGTSRTSSESRVCISHRHSSTCSNPYDLSVSVWTTDHLGDAWHLIYVFSLRSHGIFPIQAKAIIAPTLFFPVASPAMSLVRMMKCYGISGPNLLDNRQRGAETSYNWQLDNLSRRRQDEKHECYTPFPENTRTKYKHSIQRKHCCCSYRGHWKATCFASMSSNRLPRRGI